MKRLWIAAGVLVIVALAGYWGWGEYRKQRVIGEAVVRFSRTPVESLMAYVDCNACPLERRNDAAWALGELRATQAAELLKQKITNQKCRHTVEVCQHELQRAIMKIDGTWGFGVSLHLRHDVAH